MTTNKQLGTLMSALGGLLQDMEPKDDVNPSAVIILESLLAFVRKDEPFPYFGDQRDKWERARSESPLRELGRIEVERLVFRVYDEVNAISESQLGVTCDYRFVPRNPRDMDPDDCDLPRVEGFVVLEIEIPAHYSEWDRINDELADRYYLAQAEASTYRWPTPPQAPRLNPPSASKRNGAKGKHGKRRKR